MRRLVLGALLLAFAAPAAAAPPRGGLFVPGRSLGGIRLGMTPAQVRAGWGSGFGVCQGCRHPTWYYVYRHFEPEGAGVEFRRGRVAAVFTLWSPAGWRTPKRLEIGDESARITQLYGPLESVSCGDYAALVSPAPGAVSAFYVVEGRLWAFGLARPGVSSCR